MQFATNHLGHFELTAGLWQALKATKNSRIISLSSSGHRFSPVMFEDINFENRPYDAWTAYGQSKTANILFAVGIDKRAKEYGVRAYAVHPGGIPDTNLSRHLDAEVFKNMGLIDDDGNTTLNPLLDLKSVYQGAATQVWAATSPKLMDIGGVYCADSDITGIIPDNIDPLLDMNKYDMSSREARLRDVAPYAIDNVAADKLWQISEELTGVKFEF